MVTDALRPVFEKEGLTLIPPAAGAQLVVDSLENAATARSKSSCSPSTRRSTHPCFAENPPRRRPKTGDGASTLGGSRVAADSQRRTSLTVIRSCRWRSSWNGWPKGLSSAIRDWSSAGSTTWSLQRGDPGRPGAGESRGQRRQGRPSGREFTVPVELWGTLANGREVTHARADVVLADRYATDSPNVAR